MRHVCACSAAMICTAHTHQCTAVVQLCRTTAIRLAVVCHVCCIQRVDQCPHQTYLMHTLILAQYHVNSTPLCGLLGPGSEHATINCFLCHTCHIYSATYTGAAPKMGDANSPTTGIDLMIFFVQCTASKPTTAPALYLQPPQQQPVRHY